MKVELEPGLPSIEAFPQDLSRVFLNLVNNACYAAYEKKKTAGAGFVPMVVVSTHLLPDRTAIHVRDNGSGIPEEISEKIFLPFFTTKPAGSGTGLGLWITYDIVVKGHGGELGLESTPGEFTEFTVLLPPSQRKATS